MDTDQPLNKGPMQEQYDAARQGEAEPHHLQQGNDAPHKRIDHCGNQM